jgi:hypothetical protein
MSSVPMPSGSRRSTTARSIRSAFSAPRGGPRQRPGLGDDLEVGLPPEQVGEGLAEPEVVLQQENARQNPSPLS